MQWIHVTVALLLGSVWCQNDIPEAHSRFSRSNGSSNNLALYDQLKQKYVPHCLKNGGQEAADEFVDGWVQMEMCKNKVKRNLRKKTEEDRSLFFDYICDDFRQELRGCLVHVTAKMEACSSNAEMYTPKFGLRLYDSVFEFLCQNNALALRKLMGAEGDPCWAKVHGSTNVCLDTTEHIKYYASKPEAVATEEELCSDLNILRNCFIDAASQKCPNNNEFNELVVGFTDSIYAPCSGVQILDSS